MKRLIQFTFVLVGLILGSTQVMAQQVVSIKELNSYDHLTEFTTDSIGGHPLGGVQVEFTAVITSYPKSSGNASFTPAEGENEASISRIHVFVTDTAAHSQGREGMSMQIVEDDYQILENFERGDVVTFYGALTYYFETAQMTVDSVDFIGSTQINYPEFAPLLEPWEVSLSDLNVVNPDGTVSLNTDNYWKYQGAYVKISDATVSDVASSNGRIDWAVNQNGSRIYTYDQSLRFRNDKPTYLPTYNFRQGEDGDFEAPIAGALVNVSGFLILNGNNGPAGDEIPFSINPWEDGAKWVYDSGTEAMVRCVDGGTCLGDAFSWPNDYELLGLPPVFSEVSLSDSAVTSEDVVTVSATIQAVESKTVTGASLIYTAAGVTDTVAMSAAGDVYSATFPSFDAGTAVSFYLTAEDSEGLTAVSPLSGAYGFFVQGEAVTSISEIQMTDDGMSGDSPLAGSGTVAADITATVTSSAGFMAVQDKAAAWSGVFVDSETSADLSALQVGDMIKITAFSVLEDFGITYIGITGFENLGTKNTQMDTLAVTGLVTQDIDANFEPYEGVLLTFTDLKVTTNQADGTSDFGEWEFGSVQGGGAADTLEAGEGLRVDDISSNISSGMNDHVKIGAAIDSFTGVLYFSFSNPKMLPRTIDDISGDDWSYPDTRFNLDKPMDGASVEVTSDLTITWEPTIDFDGNDVEYEFVLYSADTSSVVAKVPSNSAGADTAVTLSFSTVDDLLAGAGLEVGQSADFVWTVLVNDGVDTLAASESYSVATNSFTTLYYSVSLERGLLTSAEEEFGVPNDFALKQNYPNPFNPSTSISFNLPQSSKVTLTVFDMLGRKVATLLDGEQMQAARHAVRFNASALASGMYIYRLEAGTFVSTRKMMLIK